MIKQILTGIFCLSIMGNCLAMENTFELPENNAKETAVIAAQNNTDYINSMAKVSQAYTAYITAKTAANAFTANENYAFAIDNISQAVALDKDNAEAWLLGAQIYRARGGIGYAKNYFSHAQALYEKKLVENMNDPSAKLKYAIACYAGDSRYLSDYGNYKMGAVIAANEALKLITVTENNKDKPENDLAKFAAYLILQDSHAEEALLLLKKHHDKDSLEYKLATEIYEDMVAQGKWFWPVSSKENAEKEFLVYCLVNGVI